MVMKATRGPLSMPMRVLPYLAIFTFAAGLSLLLAGWFFSPGETAPAPPAAVTGFDARPTVTPTATPTNVPSPTPTPAPFDGRIARMISPALGIDHAVEEIGILPNNQLDTPRDAVNGVGWYYIYDKPGFGGNAVFAAHVNYNRKPGPFVNLANAKPGDQITVQMENGPAYVYEVFFFQRYYVNTMPMGDLIAGVVGGQTRPEGEEWITLITCGGRFVANQPGGFGEYLDRDVVVARRVQ
jgi:hypothetical protein